MHLGQLKVLLHGPWFDGCSLLGYFCMNWQHYSVIKYESIQMNDKGSNTAFLIL